MAMAKRQSSAEADDNELMTIPQVQRALGCSQTKIYMLMKQKRLRRVKFDRSTRITAESLKKLLREITKLDGE